MDKLAEFQKESLNYQSKEKNMFGETSEKKWKNSVTSLNMSNTKRLTMKWKTHVLTLYNIQQPNFFYLTSYNQLKFPSYIHLKIEMSHIYMNSPN